MTLWTQRVILLSDPLRGDLSLSALVCLPGSATWLPCPCCTSVLAASRDLSCLTGAGVLLSFYLPAPNLMAVAFWHILVDFLWKCPSVEAVWTEEYPTGQPFHLAFASWVEGTAFGITLSTFIKGVFCSRLVINLFSFSWFIADLELFSLWVYARVSLS